MKNQDHPEVVVVGGGPGGSAAAKLCAEAGLRTVLVEKKKLPRDKVCSGMIMGDWALTIIEESFGKIPQAIFASPPELLGHRFYVAGADVHTLNAGTLLCWRKDLDHWFVRRAGDSGVIVHENTRCVKIEPDGDHVRVELMQEGRRKTLLARFVIGGDGATSIVRRSISPNLKVVYSGPVRIWYEGQIDLDKKYIHWFFPRKLPRPRFNVNQKDGYILLEGAGLKELSDEVAKTLSPFGFNAGWRPVKKDGCAIALLHQELISGRFIPAKNNVLLVGDAAGLILPITFEGIGTALKSGIAAAQAIIENSDNEAHAARAYLASIQSIIQTIGHLYQDTFQLKGEMDPVKRNMEPNQLASHLVAAYNETLCQQK